MDVLALTSKLKENLEVLAATAFTSDVELIEQQSSQEKDLSTAAVSLPHIDENDLSRLDEAQKFLNALCDCSNSIREHQKFLQGKQEILRHRIYSLNTNSPTLKSSETESSSAEEVGLTERLQQLVGSESLSLNEKAIQIWTLFRRIADPAQTESKSFIFINDDETETRKLLERSNNIWKTFLFKARVDLTGDNGSQTEDNHLPRSPDHMLKVYKTSPFIQFLLNLPNGWTDWALLADSAQTVTAIYFAGLKAVRDFFEIATFTADLEAGYDFLRIFNLNQTAIQSDDNGPSDRSIPDDGQVLFTRAFIAWAAPFLMKTVEVIRGFSPYPLDLCVHTYRYTSLTFQQANVTDPQPTFIECHFSITVSSGW